MTQPTMRPSPSLISTIFTSISKPSRRWTLTRILQSDNPLDIHGELRGTATFTPLPSFPSTTTSTTTTATTSTSTSTSTSLTGNATATEHPPTTDILYHEEGEMPRLPGMNAAMGLRFTKKYIWRLSPAGRISVWFAKVGQENEPDYLFHEFEFHDAEGTGSRGAAQAGVGEGEDVKREGEEGGFVAPPTPPGVVGSAADGEVVVVTARGNHLCINDMYRTAYAFRVRVEDGEVVSWASRHVVKGPRKNQDIVNLYRVEG